MQGDSRHAERVGDLLLGQAAGQELQDGKVKDGEECGIRRRGVEEPPMRESRFTVYPPWKSLRESFHSILDRRQGPRRHPRSPFPVPPCLNGSCSLLTFQPPQGPQIDDNVTRLGRFDPCRIITTSLVQSRNPLWDLDYGPSCGRHGRCYIGWSKGYPELIVTQLSGIPRFRNEMQRRLVPRSHQWCALPSSFIPPVSGLCRVAVKSTLPRGTQAS